MSSGARIAAGGAAAVLIVLIAAQLVLPSLAARRIRSRIDRYGHADSVTVRAFPAIRLLWGSASSVSVSISSVHLSPAQAVALLKEGSGSGDIHVSAADVQIGAAHLSDATLTREGDQITASASASAAEVAQSLPAGTEVSLLGSEGGSVSARVSGSLFGIGATLDVIAGPSEGAIVVRPQGLLLGAFSLTLFSSPHVYVQSIGASVQSEHPLIYRLTLSALLT